MKCTTGAVAHHKNTKKKRFCETVLRCFFLKALSSPGLLKMFCFYLLKRLFSSLSKKTPHHAKLLKD